MQINKEFLKSLNPCADRYKNYLEHHGEFSGSLSDFLGLPDLDYNDKVWVAERVLNKNQAVNWSILCAESVVHMFEDKHPGNKSLSNCIEFLKTVNDFNNLTDTEKEKIKKHLYIIGDYYAAYAVGAAHALYAANATYAACAAACEARYAVDVATYATNAAYNAANAAAFADEDAAKHNQQALNLQFLKQAISL